MLERCDLPAHGECSCAPSGVPCKVQSPVYLILEEANNGAAKRGNACLIALVLIVVAVFGIANYSFARVERAYEQERV